MRKWLNQLTNAVTLCIESDKLILLRKENKPLEAKSLAELPLKQSHPLIVAINPMQFLQVHQRLSHLYLTPWQQDMSYQLTHSPFIVRSLLFVPHLIPLSGQDNFQIVDFLSHQYLHIVQNGIHFWNQCKQDNLSHQVHEAGLYLKRHHLDVSLPSPLQQPVLLKVDKLMKTALQHASYKGQSEDFPVIKRFLLKRDQSHYFTKMNIFYLILSTVFTLTGIFFVSLCLQTIFSYNPWSLKHQHEELSEHEKSDLKKFKDFMDFQQHISFSTDSLKQLFRAFPGKIVATDMMWEQGVWTLAFIINPLFVEEFPQIKKWTEENLKNSKLIESESTIHHYTLQFEEKGTTDGQ